MKTEQVMDKASMRKMSHGSHKFNV